jgi:phosphoadenosine phosphosulfate reductase
MNREQINKAITRIEDAYVIAEKMGKTLVVAYSGGKDSDVLLDLAVKSELPFEAQHNHTTVDAPETVYYIREKFATLTAQGIPTQINRPPIIETADGKQATASMWKLIPKEGLPPTRLIRYCCAFFKERNFEGQHIITGVRWAESAQRKTRGLHEALTKKHEDRIVYVDENDDAKKITDICHTHGRIATNPIIDWSDVDVWVYIKEQGIKINPLYGLGFLRIGCIGCPLAGKKGQARGFALYPKYEQLYLRAFGKMIDEHYRKTGAEYDTWKTPEEVMAWWTQADAGKQQKQHDPNQMVIDFDLDDMEENS